MDYKTAVYIGRFQPFHNGHLEMIKHGLSIAEKVLVFVGSAGAAPSPKNPWSYDDRRRMIWNSFELSSDDDDGRYVRNHKSRLFIRPLRDYYYNENAWLADIQAKASEVIREGDSVALIGQYKDGSSYYLRQFPQWEFVPTQTTPLNATDIRSALFESVRGVLSTYDGTIREDRLPDLDQFEDLPSGSREYLQWWVTTPAFPEIANEYFFVKGYKEQWASAPYPPTFVTTDAVVTCSGHVLVVKRKHNPGKGLYALPGGFLRPSEAIQDGMLRELREETGIRVDKLILRSSIAAKNVFDHPDRSLRGRTISHGFHIKLRDGELPEVSANDDAAEVMWMPLWDVIANESKFFEDHAHIISYFTTLGVQGGR